MEGRGPIDILGVDLRFSVWMGGGVTFEEVDCVDGVSVGDGMEQQVIAWKFRQ